METAWKSGMELSAAEREELEALSRLRKGSHQLVQRARIILMAAEGKGVKETMAAVRATAPTVRLWKNRWAERAGLPVLDRLEDRERPGAPAKYTVKQAAAIVAIACEKPGDCGRPIQCWSLGEIRKEAIKRGIVQDISRKSISRFLKGGGPSPGQGSLLDQHASGRGFRPKAGPDMRGVREGAGAGGGRGENVQPR